MKTTKKDFEDFKHCCEGWINRLGVKDWSIHFDHDKVDDSYAQTYWKISARVATIVFSTHWDDLRKKTDAEINRLALHEVLHVLLAPLVVEAEDRYSTQSAIETAEHSIIRQLENIIT